VALQSAALLNGQRLFSCRIDKDWTSVGDLQVWWNGVGTRTYVQLPVAGTHHGEPDLPIGLDGAGIKLTGQSQGLCAETQVGVYFDSNRDVFNNEVLASGVVEEPFPPDLLR
jgi:hypothetical protein